MSEPAQIQDHDAAPFKWLPLPHVHHCPTNPRGSVIEDEAFAELVTSIRDHGVLQPILVRPREGGGWEVVCGHRRVTAAVRADLAEVPATVRELSDRDVLEIQLAENLQRADVHPLQEADGYRRLIDEFGYSVEQLAGKVHKSTAYVYQRLQLGKLPPKAREAFLAGKLTLPTARLVARIPVAKLAEEATKQIVAQDMTARHAAVFVQRQYMLSLKTASFDTTDPTLLPSAKSCAECPKRTGAQSWLFEDVASADVCTDPTCFQSKLKAHGKRLVAAAKAKGQEVLPTATCKALFPYENSPGYVNTGSGYVSADTEEYIGGQYVKVRALTKHLAPPAIAVNPRNGVAIEVWTKKDLDVAIKKAGLTKTRVTVDEKARAAAKRERERIQVREEADRRAIEHLVARVVARQVGTLESFWRLMAELALKFVGWGNRQAVAERRGWLKKEGKSRGVANDDACAKAMQALSADELRGLAFELVACNDPEGACQGLGVDYEALERAVRDERKAAAKDKSKSKRGGSEAARRPQKPEVAGSSPAPATNPGVCRVCGCTEEDCEECIEATGEPCSWVDDDCTLCSRCASAGEPAAETKRRRRRKG